MKMKRAYKFLREEWAICAIKDRRIKISEIDDLIDDLNDVAELSPYRTSTTEQRDQIPICTSRSHKKGPRTDVLLAQLDEPIAMGALC